MPIQISRVNTTSFLPQTSWLYTGREAEENMEGREAWVQGGRRERSECQSIRSDPQKGSSERTNEAQKNKSKYNIRTHFHAPYFPGDVPIPQTKIEPSPFARDNPLCRAAASPSPPAPCCPAGRCLGEKIRAEDTTSCLSQPLQLPNPLLSNSVSLSVIVYKKTTLQACSVLQTA